MSKEDRVTVHLREADEALRRARGAIGVAHALTTCLRTKARLDSVGGRIDNGLSTVERLLLERTTPQPIGRRNKPSAD